MVADQLQDIRTTQQTCWSEKCKQQTLLWYDCNRLSTSVGVGDDNDIRSCSRLPSCNEHTQHQLHTDSINYQTIHLLSLAVKLTVNMFYW